ncbi:hypothetical protein K469DRAFT_19711 [Zopfia rhizophila CBS 207.26]|uniref:Secreted protein n=1 Tax=Zopfia rhizophila CBS 207.26 TaxID=1314779 RepID=A0A6A6EX90_9PEZI|nr:hypothetical protein K469DRAFT_19711 [Zopfia rhizophila CBS 207.26]
MMLLCCAIVSFRLAISCTTSSSLALPPSRSSEMESRLVGKGSSSWSASCCVLEGASACGCDAVALVLGCLSWAAVVRVFSACCVSSTFALSFLARALGAAGSGVDRIRLGVEVAIGGLARCPEGRMGHLTARTRQLGC